MKSAFRTPSRSRVGAFGEAPALLTVEKENTTIIDGAGQKDDIQGRCTQIRVPGARRLTILAAITPKSRAVSKAARNLSRPPPQGPGFFPYQFRCRATGPEFAPREFFDDALPSRSRCASTSERVGSCHSASARV